MADYVLQIEELENYFKGWIQNSLNSLPNDKILALTKFKAFADDKIIVTQTFVLGRVEKHCGTMRKC